MFGKINNPKGINQWSNIGAVLKAKTKQVGNTIGAKLKTAKSVATGLPKIAKASGTVIGNTVKESKVKNLGKTARDVGSFGKGVVAGTKFATKLEGGINDTIAKVKNKVIDVSIAPNKASIRKGMNSAANNAKSKISHAAGMVTSKVKGIDTKKAVNAVLDKGDAVLSSAQKGVNRGVAGAKNIGLQINHKVTGGGAVSRVSTSAKKAKNSVVAAGKNVAIDANTAKRKLKRKM